MYSARNKAGTTAESKHTIYLSYERFVKHESHS